MEGGDLGLGFSGPDGYHNPPDLLSGGKVVPDPDPSPSRQFAVIIEVTTFWGFVGGQHGCVVEQAWVVLYILYFLLGLGV